MAYKFENPHLKKFRILLFILYGSVNVRRWKYANGAHCMFWHMLGKKRGEEEAFIWLNPI